MIELTADPEVVHQSREEKHHNRNPHRPAKLVYYFLVYLHIYAKIIGGGNGAAF